MKKAPSFLKPNSVAVQITTFTFHGFVVLLSILQGFIVTKSFEYRARLQLSGIYGALVSVIGIPESLGTMQ
ncbi:hypothetical protein RchiOBHm_Chr5g0061921 [Rosa chinensis]|uniref:Uncharacterized protein n=1 Tax=Rosa chinensis TaxID=74649 RepID=A0A2P6QI23_ROSCH|nr:hypothetical protein RchiOBHm_Chr5g0061921 [Rosa chinensis]